MKKYIKIQDKIRICRFNMRLNQAQFGELLGVSRNAVSDWETGRYRPRKGIRNKLKEMI